MLSLDQSSTLAWSEDLGSGGGSKFDEGSAVSCMRVAPRYAYV